MKKELNNIVVEVLDLEHGQKVKDEFINQDIDYAKRFDFSGHKNGNFCFRYYGIIEGIFKDYSEVQVIESKAKIITLEQLKSMKKITKGFLSEENIDHNSEQFQYIKELHSYLWKFVRCQIKGASGYLDEYIDLALEKAMKEDKSEYSKIMYVGNNLEELIIEKRKRKVIFKDISGYWAEDDRVSGMAHFWKYAQDIEPEKPEPKKDIINITLPHDVETIIMINGREVEFKNHDQ